MITDAETHSSQLLLEHLPFSFSKAEASALLPGVKVSTLWSSDHIHHEISGGISTPQSSRQSTSCQSHSCCWGHLKRPLSLPILIPAGTHYRLSQVLSNIFSDSDQTLELTALSIPRSTGNANWRDTRHLYPHGFPPCHTG